MATDENTIGTLNENPLHAALKEYYARPGDRIEAPLEGYVADILRGDLVIEIQTVRVSAIRAKLRELAARRPVRLVYPLPRDKYLVKLPEDGQGEPERRLSPKHCNLLDLFDELVGIPRLLANPNFSLHALLTREEEVRRREPGRAWRRNGWLREERRLLEVVGERLFETAADLADLLPEGLPEEFTTADIAERIPRNRNTAQKMCYCLRKMAAIDRIGSRGRAYLYRRAG